MKTLSSKDLDRLKVLFSHLEFVDADIRSIICDKLEMSKEVSAEFDWQLKTILKNIRVSKLLQKLIALSIEMKKAKIG